MNILHLKYAVEISKTGSISKAAQNLYMGQPNLSRAIKELEDNIGFTIFNRTTKTLKITPKGEEFISYAKKVLMQIDEMEHLFTVNDNSTQSLSVCVPRASYIAYALSHFAKDNMSCHNANIVYKETNNVTAVKQVSEYETNLAIVRYETDLENYYDKLFEEKELISKPMTEFSYILLLSLKSTLCKLENIHLSDLKDYIEICHSDSYIPSIPSLEGQKTEVSTLSTRKINIYERGSQFMLLEQVKDSFMWVSPVPTDLLLKYNLTERKCVDNSKIYKDVLIYRKDYHLTDFDKKFIEEVLKSKKKYI